MSEKIEQAEESIAKPTDEIFNDEEEGRALSRRGPIPEYILDNIAIMGLNGASTDDIHKSTGVSARTITRLMKGGANVKFDAIYEGYRKRVLGMTVQHQMRLATLLEKSYSAISRALDSPEDRIASDAAFKLMDRAIPRNEKSNNEFNVNVGFQNNLNLQTQANSAFAQMAKELESLIGNISTIDVSKHIKDGEDVLPSATIPEAPTGKPVEEAQIYYTLDEDQDK